MTFPSTFSAFNRPSSSDKLNSPSHSALHNTVSSAVGQIEQYLGLSTSSAVGSLTYDIRSPDSNGGGHVQTANKGGTGQTAFTKGDVLVASSSSVLTKLAVGSDSQVLTADSSQATGVRWVTTTTQPKLYINGSIVTCSVAGEVSILSATIPGSTLGTNNAVRATVFVTTMTPGGVTNSLKIKAIYGTTSLFTVYSSMRTSPIAPYKGTLEIDLLAANSQTNQRFFLSNKVYPNTTLVSSFIGYGGYQQNMSSTIGEDSGADKKLGLVASWDSDGGGSLIVDGVLVEKIN